MVSPLLPHHARQRESEGQHGGRHRSGQRPPRRRRRKEGAGGVDAQDDPRQAGDEGQEGGDQLDGAVAGGRAAHQG